MHTHDVNEVSALLHIQEKAAGHPSLKAIVDAAMARLEQIVSEVPNFLAGVVREVEQVAEEVIKEIE